VLALIAGYVPSAPYLAVIVYVPADAPNNPFTATASPSPLTATLVHALPLAVNTTGLAGAGAPSITVVPVMFAVQFVTCPGSIEFGEQCSASVGGTRVVLLLLKVNDGEAKCSVSYNVVPLALTGTPGNRETIVIVAPVAFAHTGALVSIDTRAAIQEANDAGVEYCP
jgi:hypothetical protein